MSLRLKVMIVILAGLIALGAKFGLSRGGHNADFESYLIVSDLVVHNQNVYQNTYRYNYAPVWFNVMGVLRWLAPEPQDFRNAIILLLGLADIGISLILLKQFGLACALVFALNPLSMLITGFHNQFDCLAIFLSLVSAVFYRRYEERGHHLGQLWLFVLFFSLSLMTKHILIFLPLILLFRTKPLKHNLLLGLPWLCFVLSILAYMNRENYQAILQNVVFYKSHWGTGLVPNFLRLLLPSFVFQGRLGQAADYLSFVIPIIAGGLIMRRDDPLRLYAYVLAMTFAFSPIVANQYVVIPMAFVAINWRTPLHWYYMTLATLFILGHHHGLRIQPLKDVIGKQWYILQAPILISLLPLYWRWRQTALKPESASAA